MATMCPELFQGWGKISGLHDIFNEKTGFNLHKFILHTSGGEDGTLHTVDACISHFGQKGSAVVLVFISFSHCFSPAPVPSSLRYKDSHGKCPNRSPKWYPLHFQ